MSDRLSVRSEEMGYKKSSEEFKHEVLGMRAFFAPFTLCVKSLLPLTPTADSLLGSSSAARSARAGVETAAAATQESVTR
jgi:hypothetical protein